MSVRSEIVRILDAVPILGGRVYADERPADEPLPHAIVLDGVTFNPALAGDARSQAWRQGTQVDLWEDRDEASEVTRDAVIEALDGAQIDGAFHLRVTGAPRLHDPDQRLAHTTILLEVVRLRRAAPIQLVTGAGAVGSEEAFGSTAVSGA